MRTLRWTTFALFALGLLACGSDDESIPSGPNLGVDGGIPRLDGGDPTGLTDGGAPGTCRSQIGRGASNTDLLNACAEGCQPFDNAKRLPGYQAGKLPPLQ